MLWSKSSLTDRCYCQPISVFAVEKHPETLARHCVLLATALDSGISLRERTELFLEIYGNAFLSPKGLDYVKEKADQAARVLSGSTREEGSQLFVPRSFAHFFDADATLCDAIDWSFLKHKVACT